MGRVLTNNIGVIYARETSPGISEGAAATGTLTFTGQPLDTETVVIGSKTYTFDTSLSNTDGHVAIGASTADSISNLAAAINLGAGPGTAYAVAMTANTQVSAVAGATTLVVTALSGGTAGNSIATTETLTNGSWGAATLEDGADISWYEVESNDINQWGSTISKTPRNPISKNRQRQKGATTDLDSGVEIPVDLTMSSFEDWIEGFCFASLGGAPVFTASACDTDSFTVADIGVTLSASPADLIYTQNAVNSANNGFHVVNGTPSATDIPVTTTLVAETLPATFVIEKCGFRGDSGDLSITADGKLLSASLNFATDTEIQVGQSIHLGGPETANRFTAAANFGVVRVVAMETTSTTNDTLVLDRANSTLVLDAGTGKSIDILYGRFVRNVAVDDADFLEQSFVFEGSFPNLGAGGATAYEYPTGNYCDALQFALPLASKAELTVGFKGMDTAVPTTTRRAGASAAASPKKRAAFNTAADFMRLRVQDVDETGLTTDFKEATLTLLNNVEGEKVLDNLGPKYMNYGNLEVSLDATLLFSDPVVPARIRNNTTVQLDFTLRNENGAIHVDLPSGTLDGGGKEFPVNESVRIQVKFDSFEDPVLGTSIGVSLFPYLPTS
jgi:hypothetical protein